MKKLFYSFVMLVTLVIVAGTAMAQTGVTPYPGGTYTYTLSGIVLQNNGTVDLSITGGGVITAQAGLTKTANPYDIDKAITSISFTVAYPLLETPGIKIITVKITDGTTQCFNTITKNVDVQNPPALSLSILASGDPEVCQGIESPGNNIAAAVTLGNTTVNTLTFTVKPVVTNVATGGLFNYEYKITLPTNSILTDFAVGPNAHFSGGKVTYTGVTPATLAPDVFTVTFKTTTGVPNQPVTATLGTTSGDSKMTITSGGGVYNGTITSGLLSTDEVIVKSMPSISTFTWNP